MASLKPVYRLINIFWGFAIRSQQILSMLRKAWILRISAHTRNLRGNSLGGFADAGIVVSNLHVAMTMDVNESGRKNFSSGVDGPPGGTARCRWIDPPIGHANTACISLSTCAVDDNRIFK